MFYHASIIKEIKLATFLIDTFVIAPLNDELCYEKGENITHFAIEHRQKTYSTSLTWYYVSNRPGKSPQEEGIIKQKTRREKSMRRFYKEGPDTKIFEFRVLKRLPKYTDQNATYHVIKGESEMNTN